MNRTIPHFRFSKIRLHSHCSFLLLMQFAALLCSLTAANESSEKVNPRYLEFITELLENNDVSRFILPDELESAKRLGITFEDTPNKSMISFDIPENLKADIRNGHQTYSVEIVSPEPGFEKVIVKFSGTDDTVNFLFQDGCLISPVRYHTRNWKVTDSEYFRFFSNCSGFPTRQIMNNLDHYFEEMGSLLAFSPDKIERVRRQKLKYIFCQDQEEFRQLTGHTARGMGLLSDDAIITTYAAHTHEIMHLMINLKLQSLPLYTHPFFQEGFAVAFGGRGGRVPEVILNLGHFLFVSNMVTVEELLSVSGFKQLHPSLSYPAAGLYNRFLFDELGLERYIELYQIYSGSPDDTGYRIIPKALLPDPKQFREYLSNCDNGHQITFLQPGNDSHTIIQAGDTAVSQDETTLYFSAPDTLLLCADERVLPSPDNSRLNIHPRFEFCGAKYLILSDTEGVRVYNLMTGNLSATYVKGFSLDGLPVPHYNRHFHFSISREVFSEDALQLCR